MAMAKRRTRRKGPRLIQCYHCRHRFEVGAKTESTNCPSCSQRLVVADVDVKAILPVSKVQTCGRIKVHKKGTVNAELIEAHEGLEVLGSLHASNVICGGVVIIGPGAKWSGNCRALSVEIKPGARIEGGSFTVPDDTLGLGELAQQNG